MPGYTIVNLREIDDSVEGRVPGMEGRFSRKYLDSRDLVVVGGAGRVRLDDEVREIRQWDVIRVAPEVVRAFEAGPDGLQLIAVGGPKPEGGDGVRSETPWPDSADS